MTGALVLFAAGSVAQLSTAIFLSLFGLLGFTFFKPFIISNETAVATLAQFQIFMVVFLGMIGKLDESKFHGFDGVFIGVLLVIVTVLVMGSALALIIIEGWFEVDRRENFDERVNWLKSLGSRGSHGLSASEDERKAQSDDEDRNMGFQQSNPMAEAHGEVELGPVGSRRAPEDAADE